MVPAKIYFLKLQATVKSWRDATFQRVGRQPEYSQAMETIDLVGHKVKEIVVREVKGDQKGEVTNMRRNGAFKTHVGEVQRCHSLPASAT
jgi:hypothetical protein